MKTLIIIEDKNYNEKILEEHLNFLIPFSNRDYVVAEMEKYIEEEIKVPTDIITELSEDSNENVIIKRIIFEAYPYINKFQEKYANLIKQKLIEILKIKL